MSLQHLSSRMWLYLAVLCLACVSGCATYAPEPLSPCAGDCNVYTKEQHDLTVSVRILADLEAEHLYGVDLSSVGLQAIWVKIDNRSDHSHWLLVSALDPNYFAPHEAAALFDFWLSEEDEARASERFRDLTMPLKSPAGQVTEGYVLAPRHEGGRYISVLLTGNKHAVDFGYAVPLPDGEFDYEQLFPEKIYPDVIRPEVSLEQLRSELRDLPCCVSDELSEGKGDPINLILLGNLDEMLSALSRGGWSFTHRVDFETIKRLAGAAISGAAYPVAPVSPLYLYGRSQDIAMQRARNTILQRNHLRLWLAPFRFNEQSVWIGQVSRDINIKATMLSPDLVTHVIDPNIDEAREHVLQSLLVAGVVQRFGFVTGVPPATPEAPQTNLTEDPYFTDGLRLVLQLSGTSTISPEEVIFMEWQNSVDPGRVRGNDLPSGELEKSR
ncbi:MAG: LssY C-terminal domain-containing protein [Halioglobus sp.]